MIRSEAAIETAEKAYQRLLSEGELFIFANTEKMSAKILTEEEIQRHVEAGSNLFVITKELRKKCLECVLFPIDDVGSHVFYEQNGQPCAIDEKVLAMFFSMIRSRFPNKKIEKETFHAIYDNETQVQLISTQNHLRYGEEERIDQDHVVIHDRLKNYHVGVEMMRFFLIDRPSEEAKKKSGL